MSEIIKYKKDKYLDTSSSVHKKKILKDIINQLQNNPIGEYVLWEGNALITTNNTFQYLGEHYSYRHHIEKVYPLKSGYVRSYKIKLDYTDNKSSGAVYLICRNESESFTYDLLFGYTWGGTANGIRKSDIIDFPQDLLNGTPNHIKFFGTGDFATGGTIRYYKISLLVYDKLA